MTSPLFIFSSFFLLSTLAVVMQLAIAILLSCKNNKNKNIPYLEILDQVKF